MTNENKEPIDPFAELQGRVDALEETIAKMAVSGGSGASVPADFGEQVASNIRFRQFGALGKLIQGVFAPPVEENAEDAATDVA